jgi:hypothetical protein
MTVSLHVLSSSSAARNILPCCPTESMHLTTRHYKILNFFINAIVYLFEMYKGKKVKLSL